MKRILIIDDDHAVLDMMQEALTYEGYQVRAESEAADILQLVADCSPDIVLIDYILNGINGGELCHRLKTDQRTAGLPVIILSAYDRTFFSLGNYGCDGFIAKPFDLQDLSTRVSKLIANVLPDNRKTLNLN